MKVSLNWAQYYSNVDLKNIGTDEILRKIGAQLGAVEEVTNWGPRYDGIVVAKIVACEKHPNADRLSVCTIDDGGVVKSVARDEKGYVQVVCGAPNAAAGLTVAWLPPGVTVPATIDKDPLVLEAREIRGQVSNGMLASLAELGMSDNHEGILEINAADVGEDLTKPGTAFKLLYGMDDVVIDCENKMFTHRPDCFGILGVARELAGIQQLKFESPQWYKTQPAFQSAHDLSLEVKVESDLVPRFMAVALKNVTITHSPTWLQAGLTRVGIRPINNVVDLTNYYMQLTGQPLHAYDYDKVKAKSGGVASLVARKSTRGEKLHLLNGKTIELQDDSTIVIAAGQQAIGVGGVMGGADTEVDANTKNIIIECASFDMYNIRRTSMKYGLFTDAVTRFTKGQSPLQTDRILAKIIDDIQQIAGGQQASEVKDVHCELPSLKPVKVEIDFVNLRLGSGLSAPQMAELLNNVEIDTKVQGNSLEITPPFWRTDLEISEDIVEEIGRLYGYDKLPVGLPMRASKPVAKNRLLDIKSRLRRSLSQAGANELLTYSFVHGDLLDKVGQSRDAAYQLGNALSPELQYYRQSLTPSLLDKIYANLRAGVPEFVLYEINKTHTKFLQDEEKLPKELEHVAVVMAVDDKLSPARYVGAPYYQASKYLWQIFKQFGVQDGIELVPLADAQVGEKYGKEISAAFEPQRSAVIKAQDGKIWGIVGEYRASVRKNLKLPRYCAGFELSLDLLLQHGQDQQYHPLSRFPHTTQDMSFKVSSDTTFQALADIVNQALGVASEQQGYWTWLKCQDIYQSDPNEDNGQKHITLRIDITHPDRTLTIEEVNKLLETVAASTKQQLGAERI